MGATNAPTTCPACSNASPSYGHLKKHQRHGELLQVGQYAGNRYVLVWMTPEEAAMAPRSNLDFSKGERGKHLQQAEKAKVA